MEELIQINKSKEDINQQSPLIWAYVGDCVYELYIRTRLVDTTNLKPHKLHIESIKYVKASAQAEMLHNIYEELSDEEKEGYEHGFVSADIIKKYAPNEDYSIFMCGPSGMYHFLDEQIKSLNLERKWIRHELQGEVHNPTALPDYPLEKRKDTTVQITVHICDKTKVLQVSTEDTILQSLEKNGISAPAHCRSGECGWCHSLLVKGEVYMPKHLEHRREADKDFNYIHPCCTFPLTDIEIEMPNI